MNSPLARVHITSETVIARSQARRSDTRLSLPTLVRSGPTRRHDSTDPLLSGTTHTGVLRLGSPY